MIILIFASKDDDQNYVEEADAIPVDNTNGKNEETSLNNLVEMTRKSNSVFSDSTVKTLSLDEEVDLLGGLESSKKVQDHSDKSSD